MQLCYNCYPNPTLALIIVIEIEYQSHALSKHLPTLNFYFQTVAVRTAIAEAILPSRVWESADPQWCNKYQNLTK